MATLEELLAEIQSNYDVVEIIDQGSTAKGKILQYDLWYRKNNTVMSKRISIHVKGNNYEWYGANPIPPEQVITFSQRLDTFITNLLIENNTIKYLAVDSINEVAKKAIIIGYIEIQGEVIEKKAYVWEDENEEIQYQII